MDAVTLNRRWRIITPLAANSGDYTLAECDTREQALEIVRIMLTVDDPPHAWIRIEPFTPLPKGI